ncbi:hypothetical protein FKM82_010263 [Ascaphus truei]
MEDQQLYKGNLAASNSEVLYYQQVPHQANNPTLNHDYDSLDINASESSSSSPHLSQDSRDVTLPAGTKSIGPVDSARPTANWANDGSGNNVQMRSHLNSYDQSLPWNSQTQNDAADGYPVTYFSQLNDNRHKMTSGAFHKLDSFTQVFSRQNAIRIQSSSVSQGLHDQPSLMEGDSALRQLLSLKPTAEQQTLPTTVERYQQVPQQMQPSLGSQQQKHQLQSMQHPQQHYYYDYTQHVTQMQAQSLMQQGQQFVQQMQPHQVLPQQAQQMQPSHYYMQQHQPGQQRVSMQEIQHQQQQQRQFSGQMSQYYQAQAAVPELQHTVQQPQHHHMQLQPPSYHRDRNQKTELYLQDQSHPMQLIQLGTVPQYVYQNSQQPFRHLYKQSLASHQAQQHQEASQQKPYHNESRAQVLMDAPVGLTNAEALDNYNREDLSVMGNNIPHRPALPQEASYLLNSRGPHHSPNTTWPQHTCISEGRLQTISPDHRGLHLERPDSRNRLTCSICLKEFRSLPALNGHMRSHGGVRSSPSLKQEIIRKLHQSGTKSDHSEECLKPQQEKKRYRHRPEPLFIPPPSFNMNASYSGATLYQSQLRSPRIKGDHLLLRTQELPTYTPPPMLSPVRQGSGLFSSVITASHNAYLPLTPLTPTPRVLLCRPNGIDGCSITVTPGPGEQTVDVEPRINIGSRFQAEIPELHGKSSLEREAHKATLVWKSWPDLENKEFQQRVDVFLSMSCSSVLSGGGTNLEYALHSLFEANGDIMNALDILLLKKPSRLKNHPLANYHYAGSDKWTSTEKKHFNKGVNTYNKDFFHVQKMVKSKTMSQCVEYYYTWKRILHIGRRHRTRLVEVTKDEDDTTSVDDIEDGEYVEDRKCENEAERVDEQVQKSPELFNAMAMDRPAVTGLCPPAGSFICEMGNCGAMFCSRQALNGHARIHGGTNTPAKMCPITATARQKTSTQSGYCSVKSSPANSTTSGETDSATVFPCKVCGKVFFKIKSRNAHMKTHRQQEEHQRQKAQKAAVAAKMADTIARTIVRTTVPAEHNLMHFDHLSLIKNMAQDFGDDVAQDLEDVLEETEIMDADLLLDDGDADLLQDGADL